MAMADTKTSLVEFGNKLVVEIAGAIESGDLERAQELANQGISRGLRHPSFFNARGLWMQETGRYQHALEDFQRALSLQPGDVAILNAIGLSLLKLEKVPDAIKAFDAAIAADTNNAQSHHRKGLALATSGNHEAALAAYERAIELDPHHVEAIASVASIAARKSEPEKARMLAKRALELNPNQPTALLAEAIVDQGEKRYVEAEHRLKRILNEGFLYAEARSAVLGLLGDAYDGQKRYAEAFATYTAENEELRKEHGQRFARGRGADAASNLVAYFETTPPEIWKATDDGGSFPNEPDHHIFLLGFMRSGTTLLEQVLASNPQIVALEEKGLLHGLGDVYMTSTIGLDSLAALQGGELERNRMQYWQRVRNHGLDVKGKIFVDKQPLDTIKLPLIAKFFPKAKIIFALRDPRDVVFSCFRRHFRINVTMFEFLGLEDAARFYASIMQLADIYRKKLPLNILDHRYEDMVTDFDGRIQAVCNFIGAEWAEDMRNFSKNAPSVDIRSPSATQVRKPLYDEAVAQWRRYAKELEPIMPILKPWVEKFGYPAE